MERGETYLRVKAISEGGERVIEGWATTPREDRVGDVVEPSGAKYSLPLPLLFAHKHDEPIGSVVSATVTKAGIRIRAKLTAGVARAEEVWRLIQDGALTAVSIGFRALKQTPLATGGLRFDEWEWHELSVVSVPANPDAKIAVGKSVAYRAQSAPQPTAPRVVPLPVYVPCHDVVKDFGRARDSLPASLRKKVSDVRSGRIGGRWYMRDEYGTELAVVPPLPVKAKEAEPAQVKRVAAPDAKKAASFSPSPELLGEVIGKAINEAVRPLVERIKALEADAEQKGIRFRGFWQGKAAARGDAYTHDGSLWIAVRETDETPAATSPDWCLAARKGRDAK